MEVFSMKKLIVLLLCLASIMPIFAAGSKEEAQPATSNTTELKFWVRTNDSFIDEQVATFMAQNPEIKVTVEAVGSGYGDLRKKFSLGMQGGELPDLSIAGWSGIGSLYDAEAIVDIATIPGNEALMSDIVESFSGRCRYNGAIVAVPYQSSAPVVYYNKAILDKAGVEVPRTFAELTEAAKKCVEKDSSGNTVVYGFNTPTDTNWYIIPAVYNFGGTFFDEKGDIIVDTDAAYEVYKWWDSLVKDGIMPPNQHKTAQEDFANGMLAFYMTSCASYTELKTAAQAHGFEIGIMKFPSYKNSIVNLGGNGLIVFTKDAKKQAACAKLIAFLLDSAQLKTVVDKGFLPVTNSMLNSEYLKNLVASDPNMQVIYDQVSDIGIFIQHPAYSKTTSELAAIASEIESYPDSDIKSLLKASQAVIDEYMLDYK